MILNCNRAGLAKVLELTKRVVAKRTIIPSTACVKLTATEFDTVVIQATDAKTSLTYEASALVEKTGTIVTDALRLHGIISNMFGESVRIASGKGNSVYVSSGKQKSRMVGLPPDEFLKVERYTGNGVTIDAAKFKWMAIRASRAAAQDDARMILHGVFVDIDNGDATMVGADGSRMSVVRASDVAKKDVSKKVVVPLDAMRIIYPIMSKGDIKMSISDSGRIMFMNDRCEIVSQVIEGEYPDYNVLLPRNLPGTVKIPRDELSSAIGLAMSTIDAYTLHCEITFDFDHAAMQVSSSTFGETDAKMTAEMSGMDAPVRIGFRVPYLQDAVSLIKTENVIFNIMGSVSPVLIKSDPEDGFTHLLMPSQLS